MSVLKDYILFCLSDGEIHFDWFPSIKTNKLEPPHKNRNKRQTDAVDYGEEWEYEFDLEYIPPVSYFITLSEKNYETLCFYKAM